MKNELRCGFVVFVLVMLVTAADGAGQSEPEQFSEVSVEVMDPVGALIPLATVIFRSNSETITGHTDTSGKMSIKLHSGSYAVNVSAAGFETKKVSDFRVQAPKGSLLKTTLKVGCYDCEGFFFPAEDAAFETAKLRDVLLSDAAQNPSTQNMNSNFDTRHTQLLSLLDEEWQYELRSSPEFATSVGDNRYNDRLSDVSPEFFQADLEQRHKFLAAL